MSKPMVKTPEGRAKLEAWHQTFRARIPTPTTVRKIPTAFGETQVLVAGPAEAPPLIVLHGALASSAHLLVELGPLLSRFRVYAVDIVGQSVMSADARIPVEGNAYGQWLVEVLDALALPRTHVLGVSWGGFVALRLAAHAPERIGKLALLVPAGMVNGKPLEGLFRVGLPMMVYSAFPSPRTLKRFVRNLLTTLDDDWMPYLGDAFLNYRMDMRIPPLAKPEEFAAFTAPTLVMAADDDVSFPGPAVLQRAKVLFPNLVTSELITDCRHSPPTTDAFRQWLCGRVGAFLEGAPVPVAAQASR